ncbi:hypothetical protein [Alicyclobacillus sacchari]|nr:hypothetical protein [Alicyclobacillus sacchari]
MGILVSTVWSYVMNNKVTWRETEHRERGDIVVTRESAPTAFTRVKSGV